MKKKLAKEANTEEKLIRQAIEKYGLDAYLDTLKCGVSTTILRGDEIVRVNPDGTTVVIAKLPKKGKKKPLSRIRVK